jgi:hypothetical protein
MAKDGAPIKVSAERALAESAGVVKRTKPKAATKTLKRANSKIKGIGDLTDVPPILAYAVRLAWAEDGLTVTAGDSFTDDQRNIVISGPAAHANLMWRSSNPHGIAKMRIRPVDSSVCAGDVESAQQVIDIVTGREPIPGR